MTRLIRRLPRLLIAACVLAALVVPPAQAAALRDPPRVDWGCTLPRSKVKMAITSAIAPRGWVAKNSSTPGLIVAEIVVRGRHTLVVDIEFDSRSFDISYKSSINLNYQVREDGTHIIHRNGNRWMEIARRDIITQLSALCVSDGS